MKRLLLLLALLPIAAIAPRAEAAPTIWDLAKKKGATLSTEEVHRQVATLYEQASLFARYLSAGDPLGGAQVISNLESARAILELHKASESKDARLRYDLGLVLSRLNRYAEGAAALENALAYAPDHPFAADAWFELALDCAHLGRHESEENAYIQALARTERSGSREIIYSNLSESLMAQGKLEAGIDAAETAIELEPDEPSPRWNLAVLNDRRGDVFGAVESARHALECDPDLERIDGKFVFFEPAYEQSWYFAVAFLAMAERETGDQRKDHLMAALASYKKWLDEASPKDRYRPRALENVGRLEKQLKLKK
ncbi:MAG: tetratricopeptide repeat protein [Polyangiales bacterium]